MSIPRRITVGASAYTKMISHGLRHHKDYVCGLLIGPVDSSITDKKEIICIEAIPLLHTNMLHPQLRLGVELVETLCELGINEENKDFFSSFIQNKWTKPKIIGFYYADILTINERSPTLNKEAQHIARVLRQHYPQLLVCLLDFKKMPEKKPITNFFAFSSNSWSSIPQEIIHVSDAALKLADKTVAEQTYLQIEDLDDHLADPKASPLNSLFLQQYTQLIEEDANTFRKEEKEASPKPVANEA